MLDNIKQVLLHVIMILIAAIVLVPVKSLPVMAESYNVWVGEKQVSDENKNDVLGDGTVIFTPQDGETPATLTLNGGTISKFKNIPTENNAIIGAKSMDLIIHVTGNTTLQHEGIEPGKNGGISLIGSSNETLTITVDKGITLSTNGIHCRAAEGDSSGIYTNGSLVINGKGTINATGGSGHGSRGIEANNITIENGIITAKANPNATSIGSYGIYCKNILTISGGELIASGSTMAIWQSSTINSALNGIGYTVLNATEGTSFDSGQGIPGDSLRLYKKIHFLPNPSVSHTVTFKVKNGSWDDGTSSDKAVTLTGVEGEDLKLTADQIPAAGAKPETGYKTGSWDNTPNTQNIITKDTTYTYAYAAETSNPVDIEGNVSGRGESVAANDLLESNKDLSIKANSAAGHQNLDIKSVVEALSDADEKEKLLEATIDNGTNVKVNSSDEVSLDLLSSKEHVLASVLTPQEMVEAVTGTSNVTVIIEVSDNQSPASSVSDAVKNASKTDSNLYFFDMDMYLKKDNDTREKITSWKDTITLMAEIPESLRKANRLFTLYRTHVNEKNIETAVLARKNAQTEDKYEFDTNRLCTMAYVYQDADVPAEDTPEDTPDILAAPSSSTNTANSGSKDIHSYILPGSSGSSKSSGSSSINDNLIKAGKSFSKGYYEKTGKNTVAYVCPRIKKHANKASVPSTIKSGKKTYKVTSVYGYAFTGYDHLRSVTIGKNVRSMKANAFYGCDKLSTLKIKSRKLTAKKIKGSLKGSSINKIIILKPATDKYSYYKKIFNKNISKASHAVLVIKK